MIKYVYATKNKLSGNFNQPMLNDIPHDAAVEAFSISAAEVSDPTIKELDLYFLGTFDTKSGVFSPEVEYLLDLGTCVKHVKRRKPKES